MHRVRHRLRNIVELEIEEYLAVVALDDVDGALAVRGEQLEADLVPDDRAVEGLEQIFLLRNRVHVEGNDDLRHSSPLVIRFTTPGPP